MQCRFLVIFVVFLEFHTRIQYRQRVHSMQCEIAEEESVVLVNSGIDFKVHQKPIKYQGECKKL